MLAFSGLVNCDVYQIFADVSAATAQFLKHRLGLFDKAALLRDDYHPQRTEYGNLMAACERARRPIIEYRGEA